LPKTRFFWLHFGPASFVVNATDLTPAKAGNFLAKYADDTYLIVPATNVDSRVLELDNIETWGLMLTTLALNRSKTVEIVITDGKSWEASCHPAIIVNIDISRASIIKVLGVRPTISNKLSVSDHVTISSASVLGLCMH